MNEVKEYFKKWGSVCRMYKVGKAIHCHDTLLIFAKNYHEEQVKKLTIPVVGSTFAMEFAEYIAKEHYVLVNQIGKLHYWKNEKKAKITEQLLKDFEKSRE